MSRSKSHLTHWKMEGIIVQVDLLANETSYNILKQSGRPGSEYDVSTNQYVADVLWLCEDIVRAGVMPSYFARAFSSSLELKLSAIREWSTLRPQTRSLQNLLRRERSGMNKRLSCIQEIRQTSSSLQENLYTMSIPVRKLPLLSARSQQRRPPSDRRLLLTASIQHWVSVKYEHRVWDFSFILFWNSSCHGQYGHRF